MHVPLIGIMQEHEFQEIAREYTNNREYTPSASQLAEIRYFVQSCALPYERHRANNPRIIHVSGQPYTTADEMRIDVNAGYLRISTDYNNSSLMPGRVNLDFRAMHDLQHVRTENCNFNAWGEICAYTLAARLTHSDFIRDFLFSEIVGQVSYLRVNGEFPVQRRVMIARQYRLKIEGIYDVNPLS